MDVTTVLDKLENRAFRWFPGNKSSRWPQSVKLLSEPRGAVYHRLWVLKNRQIRESVKISSKREPVSRGGRGKGQDVLSSWRERELHVFSHWSSSRLSCLSLNVLSTLIGWKCRGSSRWFEVSRDCSTFLRSPQQWSSTSPRARRCFREHQL